MGKVYEIHFISTTDYINPPIADSQQASEPIFTKLIRKFLSFFGVRF